MTILPVHRTFLLVSLASLSWAGCENPAQTKPKAEVAAPQGATAAAAAGTPYTFSAQGSKIEWTGSKVTGKHDGSFGTFSGKIRLTDGSIDRGSVEVEIDNASITTEPAKLLAHLKGPDFFDVERFPKTRFVSTSVRPGGESGATHTVSGDLELHGVKKSITFPAKIRIEGDDSYVNAELSINRKDFGLVYPGKPDDLIRDDVVIRLAVKASKTST
jgi:polyisoprenoid-binding protein YceI